MGGVALRAGPIIGRRLSLHEVVTAAMLVAQQHPADLTAALRGPDAEPTEGAQS